VRRPHGVRGELIVEPLTNSPEVVLAPGRQLVPGDRRGEATPEGESRLRIERTSPFKDGLIVRFAGIDTLEAAERWRDHYLVLPAAELPPRGRDEVYLHELVGLRVETALGQVLGVVDSFYELPQGLMLEVRDGPRTFLVPYREEFVRRVELERELLVVDLPPGFID
jgi:16S rRNA processing protein RimM